MPHHGLLCVATVNRDMMTSKRALIVLVSNIHEPLDRSAVVSKLAISYARARACKATKSESEAGGRL